MNIVVIGLGSMGKRRIRLIRELYPEFRIFGVEAKEDMRRKTEEEFGIDTFSAISEVNEEMDCAFVCASPLAHAQIIRECLQNKWHVFTELNLVDAGYEENMRLAEQADKKLFLSSTFLYREEIRHIRSRITPDKRWNYVYHIGQYLPDWHPWESYKDFFVGDKRTNGCREILAVELPWLVETFGDVCDVQVMSDKMTDLEIDYDDNFMIQFRHKNGNKGVLVVDVVSSCTGRRLEVFSQKQYLSWNGTPDSLKEFDAKKGELLPVELKETMEHRAGYNAMIVENAYKNEICEFFDVVLCGKQPIYGFKKDKEVLALIDTLGA